MRVAVVGAGAMGSIFGARFAQAGHDTVLVDVATPLVEKINADNVPLRKSSEKKASATFFACSGSANFASVGNV